ncbi:MAG: polysaccharide deacetylase family protein [Tumebacillaceae bacterium]
MNTRPVAKKKRISYVRRVRAGKLLAAAAVCLMMFSGIGDTVAINTYVRDLKGMAIPVQTYNINAPVVALTFDVGMDGDRVGDVLDQLRKAGVKATFFMTGEWVAGHPQTARELVREGHEVGQSLYTYRPATDLSIEEVKADLKHTDAAWKKAGLPDSSLFRVPFGETKGPVAKVIRERHDQLISWSIDAAPNSDQQAAVVWKGIEKSIKPGDIIRLRVDGATAKALPNLMKTIKEAGYELRTISALQAEVHGG